MRRIAQILQNEVRLIRKEMQSDCAARYGEQEFIVLAVNTDIESAASNIAERILKAIEQDKFRTAQDEFISLTVSIGVVQFQWGEDPKVCVEPASTALALAKSKGGNQICSA